MIHDLQMQKENKFKSLMKQDVIVFLIKLPNEKNIKFVDIVKERSGQCSHVLLMQMALGKKQPVLEIIYQYTSWICKCK